MLDEGRRLQVLAAIGIDVYHPRGVRESPLAAPRVFSGLATVRDGERAEDVRVVAVCARGARAEPRLARLFARLPRSLGIAASRLAWIEISAEGALPALPDVPCYLFVGSSAARACAAQLSLTQQNQATIAVSADPSELLAGTPARRALWQVIKPLARRLRAEGV